MRAVAAVVLSLVLATGAWAEPEDLVTPQVVGGELVSPGQFPFLVHVRSQKPGGEYETCTGSLIANRWVLTAAHCATPVEVGIFDAFYGLLGPDYGGSILGVAKWVPHPGYNPTTFANDIALIKLSANATQHGPTFKGIKIYQPVAIPLATGPGNTNSGIGQLAIAGFGLTDPDGANGLPLVANWAGPINTYPAAVCDDYFGPGGLPVNGKKQLCYGDYPHSCQGDSGGPVFADALYGVVSFGTIPCGNWGSVATYVPAYLDWIDDEMAGSAPTPTPTPKPQPTAKPPANPITLGWELPPKKSDGVATGIANAQGFVFSEAGSIAKVELFVNGKKEATLPCCSERGDVQAAVEGAPLRTGFAGAISWGRLGNETHTMKLKVTDSAGNTTSETRTVETVGVLPGFGFARDLAMNGPCEFTAADEFKCSGVDFKQGPCKGDITFRWLNGKQAFEVVDGCN